MSIFVTQSVESSVTVLVFARPSPVVDALQVALQEKHLGVIVVDPFSFSESDIDTSQTYYKICWIFDDTIKGTPQADIVFQFLFSREEPVTVVSASLGDEDVDQEWLSKKEGDQQLLLHLKKHLHSAKILWVINWLDQPELFVSPLYFFVDAASAAKSLKSGVETPAVVDHVIRALVRPHHSEVEELQKTADLSRENLEQYFVAQAPEREAPSQEIPAEGAVFFESDEYDEVRESFDVRVLPLTTPKIPNRQRLYEQNISRIKQRYQKQQYLKPVVRKAKNMPPAAPKEQPEELKPLEKHLEVTIQQMFGSQRQEQRQERIQKKVIKTVKAQRRQQRQKRAMIGLTLLGVLTVLAVGLVGSFVVMRASLFNLVVQQAGTENLADQEVWQSWKTQALVNSLATEVQAFQFVAGEESLPETAAVVSAVRQMQTIHQQRQQLKQLGEQSVAQVLGKSPGDVFQTVTDLAAEQQTMYSSLSVIQTQLQSISTEFLADNEKEAIDKILSEIQQARKQVATFEQVRQLLPAFLAQNERRRVAIILQDSQELRPSGGLIEGVYLVTLEKGVIIDQQFYTPAQIEGNKSAAIPAPADYKKFLNQNSLELIDAGWGPDFTETANNVNSLLDHSLGRKADLMVGITTNTLQEILAKTGPLAVDKSNETLTDKNFFERVSSHEEQDYLPNVFTALAQRLFSEPVQASAALSVISEQLQDGQAFLVSAQPTENDVLNTLGWAGQVSTPQCPTSLGSESCQVSTIYQLESNVGLNKVGSLIKRSIQHTIQVGKNQIRHQRLVTFTNQSNSTRWPSGAYRDYLRFYLPTDAQIVMIKVGDTIIDPKTVEKGQTSAGQFVGFLVDVPIKSSLTVTLDYQQPFTYKAGVGFAFFDQKQAGTEADDYSLTISPQDGLQASVIAPKATLDNGKIIFKQPREKHQFVGVKFR